jgi:hypothetical protein
MTPDERAAVVALLERKLNATAPRDADPVASVLRRARARRRRLVASACAGVLVIAGLGAAGALAVGQGISRISPPADGTSASPSPDLSDATNLRPVSDWTGETVTFHGLTLPVPPGWTVRRSTDIAGTCAGAAPKTLWLFDVPPSPQFHGGCGGPGPGGEQMWVVSQNLGGSLGGDNPVALDPSGQPVWQPDLRPPSRIFTGLVFPWLDVWLDTTEMPDAELTAMLAAVRANPVAPNPGLQLPDRIDVAGYQRFGGTSRKAPKPNGMVDTQVVEQVLRTAKPDTALRCVPKVGANLLLQENDRDSDKVTVLHVVFDTTGACNQVTDDQGGLATLDQVALRTLGDQVHAPSN